MKNWIVARRLFSKLFLFILLFSPHVFAQNSTPELQRVDQHNLKLIYCDFYFQGNSLQYDIRQMTACQSRLDLNFTAHATIYVPQPRGRASQGRIELMQRRAEVIRSSLSTVLAYPVKIQSGGPNTEGGRHLIATIVETPKEWKEKKKEPAPEKFPTAPTPTPVAQQQSPLTCAGIVEESTRGLDIFFGGGAQYLPFGTIKKYVPFVLPSFHFGFQKRVYKGQDRFSLYLGMIASIATATKTIHPTVGDAKVTYQRNDVLVSLGAEKGLNKIIRVYARGGAGLQNRGLILSFKNSALSANNIGEMGYTFGGFAELGTKLVYRTRYIHRIGVDFLFLKISALAYFGVPYETKSIPGLTSGIDLSAPAVETRGSIGFTF